MEYKDLKRMVNEAEGRYYQPSVSFPVLMRKVYTWMAFAMIITGLTAYFVASSPSILSMIYGNKLLFYGLLAAELGFVWGITGKIESLSLTTATLMFILYSIINGATMASIFLLYTMESIGNVFFITAGTFAVMAFIGHTTNVDLTSLGKILLMGLIGIIIASLVNIFVGSSFLQLIVSYVGVVIFVGLTAYDAQAIKSMLMTQDTADEEAQKIAIVGSLMLYLDFINLFIHLLRIFGGRRD